MQQSIIDIHIEIDKGCPTLAEIDIEIDPGSSTLSISNMISVVD
jgi:hypothetical protein